MNIKQQKLANNLEKGVIKSKIDDLIEAGEVERGAGDTCLGVKKPTTPPDGVGPNGHYACRTTGWVWVEDIG